MATHRKHEPGPMPHTHASHLLNPIRSLALSPRGLVQRLCLEPDFTVADESDSADMLGMIRAELGYSSKEKRFPRKTTVRAIYSRVVNSGDTLKAVLEKVSCDGHIVTAVVGQFGHVPLLEPL